MEVWLRVKWSLAAKRAYLAFEDIGNFLLITVRRWFMVCSRVRVTWQPLLEAILLLLRLFQAILSIALLSISMLWHGGRILLSFLHLLTYVLVIWKWVLLGLLLYIVIPALVLADVIYMLLVYRGRLVSSSMSGRVPITKKVVLRITGVANSVPHCAAVVIGTVLILPMVILPAPIGQAYVSGTPDTGFCIAVVAMQLISNEVEIVRTIENYIVHVSNIILSIVNLPAHDYVLHMPNGSFCEAVAVLQAISKGLEIVRTIENDIVRVANMILPDFGVAVTALLVDIISQTVFVLHMSMQLLLNEILPANSDMLTLVFGRGAVSACALAYNETLSLAPGESKYWPDEHLCMWEQ